MHSKFLKLTLATFALVSLIRGEAFCQDKNIPAEYYLASTIPDSLKEGANSVIRYFDEVRNVKGPGKAIVKVHSIVTILNEKADQEAVLVLGYNKKFNTYSDIEMRIYDGKGLLIKKYHKNDMYDGSASDDETLVSDDRFLGVRHAVASYPITIEKQYELDESSEIDIGSWHIQGKEESVQNASYHLTIDPNSGFRYQSKNIKIKPDLKTVDGLSEYSWKVSNLKAFKLEKGAEQWRVLPRIEFAANAFKFYGVSGDFSTWQSFGNWIKSLNADVCSLTPQREEEIRKMTDSVKSEKGKVKFLYNYMQQNMRYVSIQLGIGGFKPLPATFVDQKKYGDCKALSNYMSALLKAVNIPSCYAVINAEANQEPADPAFPYNGFNHVILCVPLKGDTTWLECTSINAPFGKLGPFTENRRALLITENGGKLVNTPKSNMQDNQFNSEAHIVLSADGSAKTQIKIKSSGEYRSLYIGMGTVKKDDQKTYLLRDLNIKQPSAFDFSLGQDINSFKEIDLELEYDKFCDIMTGDKQFYKPLAFMLWDGTVPVMEKRKSDYYFDFPRQKSCVTTIDLPAGFEVETLPTNQSLKFSYGNYDVKYVYDTAKNQVTSTAKFNLTNHVIPAAKYDEMQQYMDAVVKAENKKLVIRKKA